MATVKASALIIKFQYAYDNHWGYILGQWHTIWTQSLQNQKISYMKSTFGTNWKTSEDAKDNKYYYAAMYGSKWIGHYVTDCSGLFYWAFKELGGYMYHGSNTMWDKYCVSQGKLNKGKRIDGKELKPGTAVFVLKGTSDRSHVGLYIGDGKVIEASGTQNGVIITQISNIKWAEWGELKGVEYDVSSSISNKPIEEKPTGTVSSALVNATRVALRSAPSTSATILTRVDKGQRVQVLDDEWTRVTYQGKTGYMMTKFLNL